MEIKDAKSFKQRLFGLMFKKSSNYGLSFNNCRALHTFFMRFNLDIIAKDKDNNTIKTYNNVKPWKIIVAPKNTKKMIEFPTKNSS